MSRLANTRFMIDGREICVRFRVSGTAVATLQIVLCSLTADPHQDYRTILNSAQLSSSPSTPGTCYEVAFATTITFLEKRTGISSCLPPEWANSRLLGVSG